MMLRLASAILLIAGLVQQPARDPEEFAKTLEGAARVAKLQVPRVLDDLELQPGQRVVDLGAGSGLFARPMARRVAPTGLVYAVDVDAGLLRIIERSAKEAGLTNIRTVLAGSDDPRIPEPADLIFVCDTLHHLPNQASYLERLVRALRPGGRLAIIDFSKDWPAGHEAMAYTRADLDRWTAAAGLRLAATHDYLENSYFHVYERAGARTP